MKKVFTLCLALAVTMGITAQVNVTFNVDMNSVDPTTDSLHVAGNFQDVNYDGTLENPDYANWTPTAILLTDPDMDGVFSVTLQLVPERYEFKFINGNDWPFEEDVPNACQVEVNGNSNREIWVGESDTEMTVCYASCAPCGQSTVRFRVDMSLVVDGVNPAGVHVAGDFQGWDPTTTELTDTDGNLIYEAIVNVGTASTIEYKFLNGDDWLFAESVPSECGVGANSNRGAELTETNTVLTAFCFGGCSSCVQPTLVTFKVDMSLQTTTADGVHVAGSFQGWNPGDMAFALTDDDLDNIWELTAPIQAGNYEYKFVNGNEWADGNESLPAECNSNGNRTLAVTGETMEVWFCYGQCTQECISDPDPADITFRVNMAEATVAAEGVWMITGATTPAWQAGATQMTDADADGVYECTVNISGPAQVQYKFVNGDVDVSANEENAGLEACGIANGIGGFNRVHTRSGSAESLPVVCFNECADCEVSVNEIDVVADLRVFPVPANDQLTITFNNTVEQRIEVSLVNNLGQVVFQRPAGRATVGVNTIRVDVADLAAGIYSLRISNGAAVETVQVAVK